MACASVNEPVRRETGLTRRRMAAVLAGITAPVFGPTLEGAAARLAGKPSPQRMPASAEAAAVAEIPGMPGVRLWAGSPDDFLALLQEAPDQPMPRGSPSRPAARMGPSGRACSRAGPPPALGPTSRS